MTALGIATFGGAGRSVGAAVTVPRPTSAISGVVEGELRSGMPITVGRGEDRDVTLTVRDEHHTPVALPSDGACWLGVKRSSRDASYLIVRRTAGAGGSAAEAEVRDQTDYPGQATFHFTGTSTDVEPGAYYYDAWVELADGRRYQVVWPTEFRVGERVVVPS